MRKILLSFLFIACFRSNKGFTQQGLIQGYISDAESKNPLTGATILIPGSKTDNSDMFGMFSMPGISPGQYELSVSHVGYKTTVIQVEVRSDRQSNVNINLRRSDLSLSEVIINSKNNSALHTIGAVDIRIRPVTTSQDILRIIPGLFIAQHAGGGKADQIFMRGYDIDHGTDINITVDGIPVNMVSHAHGQGYADLHFLVPETVEKVEFDKGPYFTEKGNLATAGYVAFTTKDFLEHNNIKLELAAFNTKRITGQIKVFTRQTAKLREQFYIASEFSATDGYTDSTQDFHRFNIMGKYNAWLGTRSQLSILASGFDSKWNASGQIPDRAVRTGIISRFGSIDDTEGGNTSRYNLSLKYNKMQKNKWQKTDQFYFSRYHFNLYSNFSFFLNDPVNGDMINQRESRNIFGYTTRESRKYQLGKKKANTELGAGFRFDNINGIGLSKAVKRRFLEYIRLGNVKEINSFLFINQEIELGNKWNLDAGLRYDHFKFRYKDRLAVEGSIKKQSGGLFSPKINLAFAAGKKLKLYLNNGFGFHSNDARVILKKEAEDILPRVFGTDIGLIIKAGNKLVLKTAIWHFFSQQEFVYIGDAGVVEPNGRTRRIGIDISARVQFFKWLFGDIDLNLTHARAVDEPGGHNYLPLAPSFTSIGGLTVKTSKGINASLRYRFIESRPANENGSVRADGYLLLDMVMAYRVKKFEIIMSGENLLNREWREAQFNTASRLKSELDPVTEVHYTAGAPRNFKVGISFNF